MIWNSQERQHSTPCDVVLTNQRLIGYYFVSFPRERLFFEELTLSHITHVSLRQKSFEPIFRELMISEGQRKIYIRAPRQKIETLYAELRSAIEQDAPASESVFEHESSDQSSRPSPAYGRQEIRAPFANSPLAITLLFIGGLILEIVGAILWAVAHSSQAGLPLCVAGFISVITATLVRRQRR
jgi:hypothetical protein